jgi:hypothetical protein
VTALGNRDSIHGCYICQPSDPQANPEGCAECDRDYWAFVLRERS